MLVRDGISGTHERTQQQNTVYETMHLAENREQMAANVHHVEIREKRMFLD